MLALSNNKRCYVYGAFIVVLMLYFAVQTLAVGKNGFDLSDALIPAAEILPGGPQRDGIPAIDQPQFLTAQEANFLQAGDRVLGLVRNGIAKAYPIRILNWHEVVNDRFADENVVVTFCPLCGTGMVFNADINNTSYDFGVSGLLYNSDVLLYDRNSESLWSQLLQQAVSGPMKGTKLQLLAATHTDWADWQARYPETLVLSTETGYRRDYERNPYQGYETDTAIFFPVAHQDERYHPKTLVIGLQLNGQFKAYPFTELEQSASPIKDTFANTALEIEFDAKHRTGRILNVAGEELPTVLAFWFAWAAFHPQSALYETAPQ